MKNQCSRISVQSCRPIGLHLLLQFRVPFIWLRTKIKGLEINNFRIEGVLTPGIVNIPDGQYFPLISCIFLYANKHFTNSFPSINPFLLQLYSSQHWFPYPSWNKQKHPLAGMLLFELFSFSKPTAVTVFSNKLYQDFKYIILRMKHLSSA